MNEYSINTDKILSAIKVEQIVVTQSHSVYCSSSPKNKLQKSYCTVSP